MATTVTKVVDPDSGAGYDYDSLFDWEAGEQGDLTGVRDEIAVAKCRCTGGTADTTAFTIDGWTTSATQYIKIWTDPTESYRHNGTYQTGNKYRLELSNATGIINKELCVKIQGIQIALTGLTTGDLSAVLWNDAQANGFVFEFSSGIIRQNSGSIAIRAYGIRHYFAGASRTGNLYIYNNIIYGFTNSGANGGQAISVADTGTVSLYNNTLKDCDWGVYRTSGTVTIINGLFSGCIIGDASGTITDTYCATSNNNTKGLTALGTGNRFSQTFTFVGAADFHLTVDDAGARDYGDGSTVKAIFTDDIDGVARPAVDLDWDIGADEYVSANQNYSRDIAGALASIGAISRKAVQKRGIAGSV